MKGKGRMWILRSIVLLLAIGIAVVSHLAGPFVWRALTTTVVEFEGKDEEGHPIRQYARMHRWSANPMIPGWTTSYFVETGFMSERTQLREDGRWLRSTTWNTDGTVRNQYREVDDDGREVPRAGETRQSAPWWWGITDQTHPTAPWWKAEGRSPKALQEGQ